jgi:hypothetical protein
MKNSDKLAAVLYRWLEPSLPQLGGLMGRNKVLAVFAPLATSLTASTAVPLIKSFIAGMPDDTLPLVAHSIVATAMKQGHLDIWDIVFDTADLRRLKQLLDLNLPLPAEAAEIYKVKELGDGGENV